MSPTFVEATATKLGVSPLTLADRQKMAEAEELEAVERERARRRMLSGKSVEPSGNISLGSKGQSRDKVGDKLRMEAPAGTLTPKLKEALVKHKPALMSLLSGQPVEVLFWPGVKSNVYRARQTCLEAEGCLQLTREVDCRLFPLTWCWGWCRERVSANDQAVN